jgi:xanthine dehydrogenase molybdopterin-binding subunit B
MSEGWPHRSNRKNATKTTKSSGVGGPEGAFGVERILAEYVVAGQAQPVHSRIGNAPPGGIPFA